MIPPRAQFADVENCSTPVARFRGRHRLGTVAWGLLLMPLGAWLGGCHALPAPNGPTTLDLHIADYETFVDDTLTLLRAGDLPPQYVDRSRGLIVSTPTTTGQWFEFWRPDVVGGYETLEASLHTMRRTVTINIEPVDAAARTASTPVQLVSDRSPQSGDPSADRRPAGGRSQIDAPAATRAESMTTITPPSPAAPAAPAKNPATSAPTAADVAGGVFRVTVQVDKERLSTPERQVTTTSGALGMFSARLPTTTGEVGRATLRRQRWVPLGRDGLLESKLLGELADLPGTSPADVDEASPAP